MINDHMLVVDDTLVLINPPPGYHRIPARGDNGQPIRRIGADAISTGINSVIVEEGVEVVGMQPMRELELPTTVRSFEMKLTNTKAVRLWRRLTPAQWDQIRVSCIRCADGRFIYTGDIGHLGIDAGPLQKHMLTWIPADADVLFCTEKASNTTASISEVQPCIGIRRPCCSVSPLASIMDIIRSGKTVPLHPQSERAADARLRRGGRQQQAQTPQSVAVLVSPPVVCPGTAELLVLFTFQSGCWSFCSEVPVSCHGRLYHIGCLNRLVRSAYSSMRFAYERYELAVFTENGLVSNRITTEDVYAKYLFLSFV